MPGSSPTMALREPVSRLKNVDLPTLGRPTMARRGGAADCEVGFEFMSGNARRTAALGRSGRVENAAALPRQKSPRLDGRGRPSLHLCNSKLYYRDSVASSSHPVTPAEGFSLYQFFAPGGVLSKTHSAYEYRRGQLQMAQAVEQAIDEKRHLVVEAGTGTGKTLAYLLPAIRSGKRVIISTNTKNLQEQLFFKDVPVLERALVGRGSTEADEKVVGPQGLKPAFLAARGTAEAVPFQIMPGAASSGNDRAGT